MRGMKRYLRCYVRSISFSPFSFLSPKRVRYRRRAWEERPRLVCVSGRGDCGGRLRAGAVSLRPPPLWRRLLTASSGSRRLVEARFGHSHWSCAVYKRCITCLTAFNKILMQSKLKKKKVQWKPQIWGPVSSKLRP